MSADTRPHPKATKVGGTAAGKSEFQHGSRGLRDGLRSCWGHCPTSLFLNSLCGDSWEGCPPLHRGLEAKPPIWKQSGNLFVHSFVSKKENETDLSLHNSPGCRKAQKMAGLSTPGSWLDFSALALPGFTLQPLTVPNPSALEEASGCSLGAKLEVEAPQAVGSQARGCPSCSLGVRRAFEGTFLQGCTSSF